MPLPAHYRVGTVSVTAGGLFVTGNGTAWVTGGIRTDDLFAARGFSVSIASVQSATALTLAEPWPGATLQAGSSYEIRQTADASRVLTSARAVLTAIEGGSTAKHNYTASRPPLPTDDITDGYTLGSHWLYNEQMWIATSTTAGAAVWIPAGGQALIPGGDDVLAEYYNEVKS